MAEKKLGFFKRIFKFGKKSSEDDGPSEDLIAKEEAAAAEKAAEAERLAEEARAKVAAEIKAAEEEAARQAIEREAQEAGAAAKAAKLEADRIAAEALAKKQAKEQAEAAAKAEKEAEEKAVAEAKREAEERAAQEAKERAEKAQREKERLEKERLEKEATEAAAEEARQKADAARQAAEQGKADEKAAAQAAQKEAEEAAKRAEAEAAKQAEERAEAERLATERAAEEEAARLAQEETERLEQEAAEREAEVQAAQEEEQREKERLAAEEARQEAERLAAEAAEKAKQARLEAERLEQERLEQAEQQRLKEEQEAQERLAEIQRLEAEQTEREAQADVDSSPEETAERPVEPQPDAPEEPKKKSWFSRLKDGLSQSSNQLTENITAVFTKRKLDEDTLQELEDILIQADLGVETAMKVTDELSAQRMGKDVTDEEVRTFMAQEVEKVLDPVAAELELDLDHTPHVILVVGVNGSGKTTTIGKLSQKLYDAGFSTLLVAGDTFRAAAIEQLKIWGDRTQSPVLSRPLGSDSAGLAYDAFDKAVEEGRDVMLMDTAGRLQNKTELMDELEKIIRVLRKQDPTAPHTVLLTLDATTGQNALNQVEIFKDVAGVNGLVMTKLDGTARGGILVAISAKFGLPIYFIGVGEQVDDLEPFEARDFARSIAGLAD